MQPFDLVLDWIPNVQFAGPCWALAHGLYREVGIDLRLVPWVEDGRTIVEKTLSRDCLAAGSSEDNLVIKARAQEGIAVRGLAAMFLTTPLVVMSRPEDRINALADLRGKRVAMHCDGIRILESLLDDAGIARSDLEIGEVTHDLGNLTSGRWDAVQGYAVSEPLELAIRGVTVNTLTLRGPAIHPYAQVIFASDAAVAAAPKLYRNMLDATFRGWRAAVNDPQGAAKAIRSTGMPMADAEREQEALACVAKLVLGEAPDRVRGLGVIDPARWTSNVAAYIRAGIVPSGTAALESLDTGLWPAVDQPEFSVGHGGA
jgi:ABC-type nitrate/sulfonate/bicarbonate transport system substrate-binding protein